MPPSLNIRFRRQRKAESQEVLVDHSLTSATLNPQLRLQKETLASVVAIASFKHGNREGSFFFLKKYDIVKSENFIDAYSIS